MTHGNIRAQSVRSISVSCWLCHHGAVLPVDRWPDATLVPSFGPRMICTGCGIVGADARPNWTERPGAREPHGGAVEGLTYECDMALNGQPSSVIDTRRMKPSLALRPCSPQDRSKKR